MTDLKTCFKRVDYDLANLIHDGSEEVVAGFPSCTHTEARDTLDAAKKLLDMNHKTIGTPKGI